VTEPLPAALVSFSVGLITIVLVAVVHRPSLKGVRIREAPWYAYTGGLLGPVYVVTAILLSPVLGFATFQLAAITGQLFSSLIVDALGFVVQRRKPTVGRVLALTAIVVGCALTTIGVDSESEGGWVVKALSCALAICAGAIFPVQACVNARMTQYVLTPFRATVVSFTGGVTVLLILSAISVPISGGMEVNPGEPWMWTGGCLGAFCVLSNAIGVPAIGAASYSAIFLAAQLSAAFVYDWIGAFGFTAVEPTLQRVTGVVLAACGAVVYQLVGRRPDALEIHSETTDESATAKETTTPSSVKLGEVGAAGAGEDVQASSLAESQEV